VVQTVRRSVGPCNINDAHELFGARQLMSGRQLTMVPSRGLRPAHIASFNSRQSLCLRNPSCRQVSHAPTNCAGQDAVRPSQRCQWPFPCFAPASALKHLTHGLLWESVLMAFSLVFVQTTSLDTLWGKTSCASPPTRGMEDRCLYLS
jgi:hypothetical protein